MYLSEKLPLSCFEANVRKEVLWGRFLDCTYGNLIIQVLRDVLDYFSQIQKEKIIVVIVKGFI